MLYLLIGTAAYGVLALGELASAKRLAGLGRLLAAVGSAMLLVSLVQIIRTSQRVPIIPSVAISAYALSAIWFLLLVYSLFVEIPLRAAYLDSSAGLVPVTTGTYALSRHPGVLWWGLFLLSLFGATGRLWLAAAAPLWSLANAGYSGVQERLSYRDRFGENYPLYVAYAKSVPMVVPTPSTMRRCMQTVFRASREGV